RAATTPSPTCPRRPSSPSGAAARSSCRSSKAAPPPDSSRRPRCMPSDTPTATAPTDTTNNAPVALGTVIVTGGASGLGRADAAAAEAAVHRIAERHGDLRGVVTAAGTDACGRLVDVERDTWERVIAVNLLGTAAIVRAALPHLEQTQGRVVTVASTLGWRAL